VRLLLRVRMGRMCPAVKFDQFDQSSATFDEWSNLSAAWMGGRVLDSGEPGAGEAGSKPHPAAANHTPAPHPSPLSHHLPSPVSAATARALAEHGHESEGGKVIAIPFLPSPLPPTSS
jgi:hypothetical protein